MTDQPAAEVEPEVVDAVPDESVDDRIRRLEQTIARLENTDVMEKVLTQRVLERVHQSAPAGFPAAIPGHVLDEADASAALALAAPSSPGGLIARVPILAEFRLMFLMYFDSRYRTSRMCQVGVPVVLGLMLLNYFFFNWFVAIPLLPIIGVILERIGLVVLSVVLYKFLSREAARYAAVLNYLARYGG